LGEEEEEDDDDETDDETDKHSWVRFGGLEFDRFVIDGDGESSLSWCLLSRWLDGDDDGDDDEWLCGGGCCAFVSSFSSCSDDILEPKKARFWYRATKHQERIDCLGGRACVVVVVVVAVSVIRVDVLAKWLFVCLFVCSESRLDNKQQQTGT
jgi:hypothetical protein